MVGSGLLGGFGLGLLSGGRLRWGFAVEFVEEGLVAGGAEEVAGVEVALLPGFFGRLLKLPVVEPRPKALPHRLILPRSIGVTQSVIR